MEDFGEEAVRIALEAHIETFDLDAYLRLAPDEIDSCPTTEQQADEHVSSCMI